MTESIIIDGVDVSGCNYIEHSHLCREFQEYAICKITDIGVVTACTEKHDCYYKQLQRLKAENEEIKAKLSTAETAYQICLVNKENRHKKEKRELEEQTEKLKIQNESLRNHISDLLQQLNDLKEAQNEGN